MRVLNLSMKGNSVLNFTCEFTYPLLKNLLFSSQKLFLLFCFVIKNLTILSYIQTNKSTSEETNKNILPTSEETQSLPRMEKKQKKRRFSCHTVV